MNRDEIFALAGKHISLDRHNSGLANQHELTSFANALLKSYKAELLKEAGEPVAYMTTDEEGSASMLFFDRAEALKYSGDDEPVNLFAESQLLAAVAKKDEEIERLSSLCDKWNSECDEYREENNRVSDQFAAAQEEWNQCSGLLDDAHRSIEMLEDQLATAEQRVAEACALQVATETKFHWLDAARVAKEIRSGEWRKFVKEN